jgi:hypothetical protein
MPIETEEKPDDIGADIAAAFEAQTEAPEGQQEGPARDDAGKFAKKAEEAPGEPSEPVTETVEEEPVRKPPASWSPQAKADFLTLPPHIQDEVLKRERDVEKGFETKASEIKRYAPIEAVIAPHRDRWTAHGVSEDQAIGRLLAADTYLRENPLAAIQELAQSYGVDLRMFAQGGLPQQQPALQPVMQRMQQLEAQLQARDEAAAQAQRSDVEKTIKAFSSSAEATYFADVEDDMTALIAAGRVQGDTMDEKLKNAYEMATWARPDIRKLIQADQSKPKQETAEQRQRTANAKKASGSITGSTNGAAVLAPPDESLQDTIRRAMGGGV